MEMFGGLGGVMVLERVGYTFDDVDRLCRKHLADRAPIDGMKIVRYELRESQRFAVAHPGVSAYLLERIDFDRAFRRLDKRHREVLFALYARTDKARDDWAEEWACSTRTVRRLRREAIEALRDILNA